MAKIVYNACYGGFGLSEKAMLRLAELKGIRLWPEKANSLVTLYWTVPPENRPVKPDHSDRKAFHDWNLFYSRNTFNDRDLDRADPDLVRVVEELGSKAASDVCAKLAIEELPSGTLYRITEYDGYESVETMSDISWKVAL